MTIWFLQAAVRESRITPALVAVSYTFDRHVTSTLGCYNYAPYSMLILHPTVVA